MINSARRGHGLRPLRHSAALDRASKLRAAAIARCGDFSHTPCGQPFASVFQRVNYFRGNVAVGENLAWGSGAAASAVSTISIWLSSPEHRANLLRPGWRDGGLTLLRRPGLFGQAQATVWVAEFGRRS